MKRHLVPFAALLGGWLLATPAIAMPLDEDELVEPYGMAFTVGGSFSDFVREHAQNFTQPGGGWEARYTVGTRTYLAGEAAYTASANQLDTLGLAQDAVLLGNGVEASLRANLTTTQVQPYLLAGIGWRHYEVTNTNRNTSDVAGDDDAMTLPVTAGVAYKYERFIGDLRANYRPSFFDDILAGDDVALDSASVGMNLGFEF